MSCVKGGMEPGTPPRISGFLCQPRNTRTQPLLTQILPVDRVCVHRAPSVGEHQQGKRDTVLTLEK